MPNFDGTGPMGNGPNGRGRGPCQGFAFRPYGRSRRGGYGYRSATLVEPPDEAALRTEIQALEARLSFLKGKLKDGGGSP